MLVESCPEVDEPALRHLLSLEISGEILPVASGGHVPGDRLTVRCHDGEARLIAAAGSGRAPAVERTVRLADFPGDATPRVLALAGVELLASVDDDARASAAENAGAVGSAAGAAGPATTVASAAAPVASPAQTVKGAHGSAAPAAPAQTEDPDSPSRSLWSRTRLGIAVVRRSFFADTAGVTAWGANASAHTNLNPGWAARFDLEGGVARSGDQFNSAHTYLLSAGAFWGPRFGHGDLVGSLGVGARMGLARLAGMTTVGDFNTTAVLRGWGGPAMMVHVKNGGPGWGLMLYGEVGLAMLAAVGVSDSGPIAAVQGLWGTAGAGLSF